MKKLFAILCSLMISVQFVTPAYAEEMPDTEDIRIDMTDAAELNSEGGLATTYFPVEVNYLSMDSDQKSQVKARILQALENRQEIVDVRSLNILSGDAREIINVIQEVVNSHYEYFYIRSGIKNAYASADGYITQFEFIYDNDFLNNDGTLNTVKINEYSRKIDSIINDIIGQMIHKNLTDPVGQVLFVHDYLVNHCRYDYENYLNNSVPAASFSVYGTLVNGSAVCQGYATTFSVIMQRLGIPSYFVASQAMNHAWNLVYVNDAWYHVDCTWDDPVLVNTYYGYPNNDYSDDGYVSHLYFLKSDGEYRTMERSHYGWSTDIPSADWRNAFDGFIFNEAVSDFMYLDGYWYYRSAPGQITKAKIDGSIKTPVGVQPDMDYIHMKEDKIYYSNSDKGVYEVDLANGSTKLVWDVYMDYPGYKVTEYAIRQGQMQVVLYNAAVNHFISQSVTASEPVIDEIPQLTPTEQFVTRLYSVCLNRLPDSEGLKGWTNQLVSGRETGVGAAYGFIFSSEFKNKNLCNEDYIESLYKAFMGRASDAAGKAAWVKVLQSGTAREEVFNGFALSSEFAGLCAQYGIERGSGIYVPQYGTVPTDSCSVCGKEDGVTGFVKRLYQVCLNRQPDDHGLQAWSQVLWNHTESGSSVAYGFIFSSEFTKKNYSDEVYVEYLYQAFMGRSSDAAGKAAWVKVLKNGQTRKQVFDGFVGSSEFTKICQSYGIKRD